MTLSSSGIQQPNSANMVSSMDRAPTMSTSGPSQASAINANTFQQLRYSHQEPCRTVVQRSHNHNPQRRPIAMSNSFYYFTANEPDESSLENAGVADRRHFYAVKNHQRPGSLKIMDESSARFEPTSANLSLSDYLLSAATLTQSSSALKSSNATSESESSALGDSSGDYNTINKSSSGSILGGIRSLNRSAFQAIKAKEPLNENKGMLKALFFV